MPISRIDKITWPLKCQVYYGTILQLVDKYSDQSANLQHFLRELEHYLL